MAVTMVIGNRPEISLSLLKPSYTMASVLANEFSEATNDLHIAALVEIALLLLVLTVIINAAARLMILSVAKGAATGVRE
jgi:phosphate transport system permease protein